MLLSNTSNRNVNATVSNKSVERLRYASNEGIPVMKYLARLTE